MSPFLAFLSTGSPVTFVDATGAAYNYVVHSIDRTSIYVQDGPRRLTFDRATGTGPEGHLAEPGVNHPVLVRRWAERAKRDAKAEQARVRREAKEAARIARLDAWANAKLDGATGKLREVADAVRAAK